MSWVLLFVGFIALFLNPLIGLTILAGSYYIAIAKKKREIAQIVQDAEADGAWGAAGILTVVLVFVVAFVMIAAGS